MVLLLRGLGLLVILKPALLQTHLILMLLSGTYTVRLTVTDDDGATNYIEHSVTVSAANVAPVAAFTFSATNLVVQFTDASTDSDGTIASRAWTFGDTRTSTATNPSHTYASAGTYTVRLTVTDDDGATNYIEHSVTVSAANVAPVADFTVLGY